MQQHRACLSVAHFFLAMILLVLNSMAQADTLHQITGFRQAHFGMTPVQLQMAVIRDFGPEAQLAAVNEGAGEVRQWRLDLPELAPGPGPAAVFYHFAGNPQVLERINVAWGFEQGVTRQQRDEIGFAAMHLGKYFAALSWKPQSAVTGVSLKPGEVATFIGVDPHAASVQVIAQGVPTTDADGRTFEPQGPAILSVTYLRDVSATPGLLP